MNAAERVAELEQQIEALENSVYQNNQINDRLQAEAAALRQRVAELDVTCDCHTWPTWKEMHNYVEALEKREAAARVEGLREMQEVIRRFLYEPLPGIALPEKYENPYTPSQESWNKRMDWLIAALDRGGKEEIKILLDK